MLGFLFKDTRQEDQMAIRQAQTTANTALAEIRAHAQTCEKDNVQIKATLAAQDEVLKDIRTGLQLVKWIGGLAAFAVPFVELWRALKGH